MNCINPDCAALLAPGESFCGECGTQQPAPAKARPVTGQGFGAAAAEGVEPAPVPATVPLRTGTYSAEISRQNPGCLIFLIDQSGSMEEPIAGGTGEPKKKVVADAINRLIYNTILRCSKEDGVRPYFDIGVWSYGGSNDVRPAFASELLSVADLPNQSKRTEIRRRRVPDGAGGVYEEEMEFPIWFEPVAGGLTPMHAAFNRIVAPLNQWVTKHSNSFPPIIINLTDGAYSDQSPAPVAKQIMQLGTSDGTALIFNCHISKQATTAVQFPNEQQAESLQDLARELFELSSPLPPPMLRMAQAKGFQAETGARGYVFNADQVTLIDFLDIGTRAIQDRVEND